MKRTSLYSSSRAKTTVKGLPEIPQAKRKKFQFRAWLRQNRLMLLVAAPGAIALALVLLQRALAPVPVQYTQEDIDDAVTRSLEVVPLPSHSTKAYEAVRGSIVRV